MSDENHLTRRDRLDRVNKEGLGIRVTGRDFLSDENHLTRRDSNIFGRKMIVSVIRGKHVDRRTGQI